MERDHKEGLALIAISVMLTVAALALNHYAAFMICGAV